MTLELQAVFSGSPAWAHPHWTSAFPEFLTSFCPFFLPTFAFCLILHQACSLCSPQIDDEQPWQQPLSAGEWPAAGPGGLAAAAAGEPAAESAAHAPAPADHDTRARAAVPAQERLHPADCQCRGHW